MKPHKEQTRSISSCNRSQYRDNRSKPAISFDIETGLLTFSRTISDTKTDLDTLTKEVIIMKFKQILLSSILLMAFSSHAVVLTLDAAAGQGDRFAFQFFEQNYTLEAYGLHTNGTPYQSLFGGNTNKSSRFNANEDYLGINNGRSLAVIKENSGALFDLNSIDVGSTYQTRYGTITVSGLDANGSTIASETFTNQTQLTNHSFTNFVGLSRVEIRNSDLQYGLTFDDINVTESIVPPQYSCLGFDSPMSNGAVKVKKNRVLPLKAQLANEDGYLIDGAGLNSSPVLTVLFNSETAMAVDVSSEALSAGEGSDGNQFSFNFDKNLWQFNLKTKNYSASGVYVLSLTTGDATEYRIDSSCVATFVIQ